MTSVKTQSQAVSASSSCRLAYLKLKALANESVSFASESVSLPCELRLFHYAPAKPGCWQWLWYILHTPHLHREAKWPECPGSGGQGRTVSPLQGLAVLSFIHELDCCQSERWKALHPKAKCAQGCLHTAAWARPRFAGVTAGGSPASWPGIYCCLFDWVCLQF